MVVNFSNPSIPEAEVRGLGTQGQTEIYNKACLKQTKTKPPTKQTRRDGEALGCEFRPSSQASYPMPLQFDINRKPMEAGYYGLWL